ncbi:MAG: nucleotidyltransferase family protein [Anaerolineae bacterium]|nr:nucleotidyltransferase family protein [Anaerolineae bacterium]
MSSESPAVAILAGGLATRLRPITETIPKALVEVADQPFIVHQLELLRRNGLTRIVLCVGYLGEQIEQVLGDGSGCGVQVSYSFDGAKLLGTAGALKKALPLLTDSFFILYGDSYLNIDYQAVYRAFRAAGQPGLMTVFRNADQWDRSNVIYADGRIVRYDKRNCVPEMQHIDYGLGILNRDVLAPVSDEQPTDLADIYRDLAAQGKLSGYEVFTRFYEIGSHEGLEETRGYLSSQGSERGDNG